MGKKILYAVLQVLLGTVASEAGLLLHYPFNDLLDTTVATDASGNGLSGIFQKEGDVDPVPLQTVPGVSGLADDYAYDGSAAEGMGTASSGADACRVRYVGDGFNSRFTSLSLCGWFKTESGSISNTARLLQSVGTENLNLYEAAGSGLRFQVGGSYVNSGPNTYTNAGSWTFFAVTYDSTVAAGNDNVNFWIGDEKGLFLVSSAELTGAGAWDGLGASADFAIGNRHGSTSAGDLNRPFDGYIDDFRIYGASDGSSGVLSYDQLNDIRMEPFSRGIQLVVPSVFPDHPRLVLNQSEIDSIKLKIAAEQQPQLSVWSNLIAQCSDVYQPDPYTGTVRGEFTGLAQDDGGKALDYALVYVLGGQEFHAQQAIAILDAWGSTVPLPGTQLVDDSGTGSGMYVSRGVFPMIYAADLLWNHPSFDGDPQDRFTAWMQSLIPLIDESIAAWDTNDYFNKQYYQNHLVAHTLGLISIGNLLGDQALVQKGLDSTDNPRDFIELLAGTILMPGDAPCIRETSGGIDKIPDGGWPAPEAGEIYDRYRHHTAPLRGLQYSYLSLSLLSTIAEVCQHLGFDLWSTEAPGGENLLLSQEYYSDFYRLHDAGLKSGFYATGGPYTLNEYTGSDETYRLSLAGDSGAIFELGLTQFPDSEPLKNLMRTSDRVGWIDKLLGPVSLTHGVADEDLNALGPLSVQLLKNNRLALLWPSGTGLFYRVETTTNLVEGSWYPVQTNVAGTGGTVSYTESISEPGRFFRIILNE
jgi:hypothetical protein